MFVFYYNFLNAHMKLNIIMQYKSNGVIIIAEKLASI